MAYLLNNAWKQEQDEWMTIIVHYLKEGQLLEDKNEARKVQIRVAHFVVINNALYKQEHSLPYLRCANKEEANYVLQEIHEGICGNHTGARSLAGKALRVGRKQFKFLIVAIDYFIKWVESEPAATITEAKITNFAWRNIVYGFGIPNIIISDNGRQFDNPKFRKFCQDLGIKNHYSSLRHPQANGQTEVTNRSLLRIIKTRLEGAKGAWLEELLNVLWAYRTTTRVPIGETPFRLMFGTEAVVLVEVGLMNIQIKAYEEQRNHQGLNNNLDLIDEVRDETMKRMAKYKGVMARYYNKKVKVRRFNIGDLVLRKVSQATNDSS
ncbi:uncharacterized protein LOC142608973 [Castanea sativa]|uniref:uncharacterized protein LOC142608973 n=1 Tax=Castanea sativa TaxID=21020 RepID=UPI003F64AB50